MLTIQFLLIFSVRLASGAEFENRLLELRSAFPKVFDQTEKLETYAPTIKRRDKLGNSLLLIVTSLPSQRAGVRSRAKIQADFSRRARGHTLILNSVRYDPKISFPLAWSIVLAEVFLLEPSFVEFHVRFLETIHTSLTCTDALKSETSAFGSDDVSAVAEKFRLYLAHNGQRFVDLPIHIEAKGLQRIEHYLTFHRRP